MVSDVTDFLIGSTPNILGFEPAPAKLARYVEFTIAPLGERPLSRDITNIAIIGCGYVADFYMATRKHYPALKVAAAYDTDPLRLGAFCKHFGVRRYDRLQDVLDDPSIDMVLNLTNPRSHYAVTKACLLASKHVYSEKPLAMEWRQAAELAELARQVGVSLATAPCSLLSVTCQTLWKALSDQAIGPVRLVYANFDAGMTHRSNPARWRSASNAPWPAKDEFETGCTYEHAAYVLSWLATFFGPARRVTAFSSCLIPDKGVGSGPLAPDFSVGCIEYDNNVVARVTCSVVAPTDRSIVIIGETGSLTAKCVRNDAAPVFITRTPAPRIRSALGARLNFICGRIDRLLNLPWAIGGLRMERKVKPAFHRRLLSSGANKPVDFMRGPQELAESIRDRRPCRLSPDLAVHVTELIEALQYPERFERTHTMCTDFDPIRPLHWTSQDRTRQ